MSLRTESNLNLRLPPHSTASLPEFMGQHVVRDSFRIIPGTDDSRLRLVARQVRAPPVIELSDVEVLWQLPVPLPEIPCNVLLKVAGGLYAGQFVQVFIVQTGILSLLFKPGIQQQAPCGYFACKRAFPGRILAADLQLAGAPAQAVGHPALQDRIGVGQGAFGQVKSVAICDPIAQVDLAAATGDGECDRQ